MIYFNYTMNNKIKSIRSISISIQKSYSTENKIFFFHSYRYWSLLSSPTSPLFSTRVPSMSFFLLSYICIYIYISNPERRKQVTLARTIVPDSAHLLPDAIIFRQKGRKKNVEHKQYSILMIEWSLHPPLFVRSHLNIRKSDQLCRISLCAGTS